MAFRTGDEAHSGVASPRCNKERWRNGESECTRGKEEGDVAEQWRATECNMHKRDKAKEKEESERGREKEAAWRSPLEHPQSTSPERCINISHTHTQNKRLGTQLAQSQKRERGREKTLKHGDILFNYTPHISAYSTINRVSPQCVFIDLIPSHVCHGSVQENITCSRQHGGAYAQFCTTQNGSTTPLACAIISSGCDCGV